MNNEIFFDGKQYISAHDASELSGLTRNYVARLCRSGKLQGKQIGKNWYIENAGLRAFLVGQEYSKSLRREALARERVKEYRSLDAASVGEAGRSAVVTKHAPASQARFVSESSTASGVVSAPVNRAIRVGNAGTFAASPVYEKLSAAVARKGSAVFGGVANLTASPLGVADAAARLAAKSVAHVPAYAITPVAEFFHKLTALTLAFMLTFGTYALVDPQAARVAAESVQDTARSLLATYDSVTGGGVQNLAENVQSQVALAAENPSATLAAASTALTTSIPNAVAGLARTINSRINSLVYAMAFPQSLSLFGGGTTSGSVAVQIAPYARPVRSDASNGASAPHIAGGPTTVINNPIRERTVEVQRIVAESGGITESELNDRLNQLNNKLVSQIYSITAVGGSTPVASGGVVNMIAATNRIDQLSGAAITGGTITSAAISGGSISGTSVAATTLTSSGDTGLASTTVTGNLTVSGSVNFTGSPFSATDATFTNATTTNSTSTNLFSTNASTTNATSTTLFSVLSNFTTSIIATLTAAAATITDLVATTVSGTNLTNATTTNATSTNAFNTIYDQTSTSIYSSSFTAGNATSTNLFATGATFTGATSTSLFSTTASSTNLYSTNGSIGVLSAGTLALSSALPVLSGGTGTTTAASGQLLYGGGSGVYQSVATSTLSTGTGLTVSSGSLGYQVGGANATIGFASIAASSWANMTGAAAVPPSSPPPRSSPGRGQAM